MLGLIAVVLLAAAPAARGFERSSACDLTVTSDPGESYARMGWLAQPIAAELEAWLGEQFGGFWLHPREFRWYMGIAPGAITPDQLRERALELVDARHDGGDEEMLRTNFAISQQPYGEPELRRIQDELTAKVAERRWSVGWANGVGCLHSDARRVEFELYRDATPEIVAEVRRLAEPYADRVRVVHLPDVAPPSPGALTAPAPLPAVTQLVRARGCKVLLRRSRRGLVRSLKVRRTGRRTASVRVRMKDGRHIRGTVRLRSCARS